LRPEEIPTLARAGIRPIEYSVISRQHFASFRESQGKVQQIYLEPDSAAGAVKVEKYFPGTCQIPIPRLIALHG